MEKIRFDCWKDGKKRALTMSYDDGVLQDRRLVEIFNKYGIRGSFHLNSGLLDRESTVSAAEVATLYAGHEVSAHSLTHPHLPEQNDEEIIRQVEEDRLALSELCGYEVVGFAYPCGGKNYDVDSFKNFYESMLVIEMVGEFKPEDSAELKEYLKIEIHSDVKSCEFVFYRIDSSRCYYTVDGVGGYYVLVSDVNVVRNNLQKYLNGEIVTR
jgi:peptidoglycan/xylan/chitin deacetylase (PgdA/CDA1 family)